MPQNKSGSLYRNAACTITNSRTWDNWMEVENRIDRGDDTTGNRYINVTHAATTSVTTSRLSSVDTSNSAPDLSDDKLLA